MDWREIAKDAASVGLPAIGTALMGPEGAAVGAKLASMLGCDNSPQAVQAALQDPQTAIKARELDTQLRIEQMHADVQQIMAINQTMQAEAANSATEAWYQKMWRPFNGFVVGLGSLAGVLATCALMWHAIDAKDLSAVTALPLLAGAIAGILAVPGAAVGITAWHRGQLQREQAKQNGGGEDGET